MQEGSKTQILLYGLKSERIKFIQTYLQRSLTSENYIDCYNNAIKDTILREAERLSNVKNWSDFSKNLFIFLNRIKNCLYRRIISIIREKRKKIN